jgi:hypothetical protein
MIKRSTNKKAVTGILKEKKSESNYCCNKCKKCFSSLEDMENHDCKK